MSHSCVTVEGVGWVWNNHLFLQFYYSYRLTLFFRFYGVGDRTQGHWDSSPPLWSSFLAISEEVFNFFFSFSLTPTGKSESLVQIEGEKQVFTYGKLESHILPFPSPRQEKWPWAEIGQPLVISEMRLLFFNDTEHGIQLALNTCLSCDSS